MSTLRQFALFFAWLIALLATVGSLYGSEILGWQVCPLCWLQRVALFPLVIILGLAAGRRDPHVSLYLFPQVIIGLGVASWQYFYSTLAFYFGLAVPICKVGETCFFAALRAFRIYYSSLSKYSGIYLYSFYDYDSLPE